MRNVCFQARLAQTSRDFFFFSFPQNGTQWENTSILKQSEGRNRLSESLAGDLCIMWFITEFMLGFFKSAVSCYMGLQNCFLLFIHTELCSRCPKQLSSAQLECPLSIIRVMAQRGISVYFKVYICTLQPLLNPSAKVQLLQFPLIQNSKCCERSVYRRTQTQPSLNSFNLPCRDI